METVELQILGSLHKNQRCKVQRAKEQEMDIETVDRKRKASCKSIKMKLEVLESFFYVKEKNQQLKKMKTPGRFNKLSEPP